MQCHRWCVLSLILLSACCSISIADEKPSPDELLNSAVELWRSGDLDSTQAQLTTLIDGGSQDPRVFYYRGILAELMGHDGVQDFQAGAKLEAGYGGTTLVNRALEKTQGPLRAKIEKQRVIARNAIKADPEAARLKLIYREAMEARSQNDLGTALQKFDQIIETGTDPRYFYMYGVTLAESGDVEKAQLAFAEGIKHETKPEHVQLVSSALANVQGNIRQMIEQQTSVNEEGQEVTRQSNVREIQRRAFMSQDQLLAEANAANVAKAERLEQEAEARRLAAAEAIMAENKAKQELEDKISQRPAAPVDPPAPAVAKTTEPMPEEEPAAPATASANPFLRGGGTMPPAGASVAAASSVTSGPIDTSWLSAASEYLMYVRPADLLASQFVKPMTDTPQFEQGLQQMSAQVGFLPADMDSVTVGMGNVMATLLPMIAQAGAGGPPNPSAISNQLLGGDNSMMVIRTNKDIDAAIVTQSGTATEMDIDGKIHTYYMMAAPQPDQPPMALYPVDARTFLISSEAGMKAALANGPGEATNENFSFVSRSSHMVQAFSSPLLAGMSGSIPDPMNAPPQVGAFVTAIKGKVSGGAIVLNAGSDLTVNISLNLTEPDAAVEANTALSGGLGMVKQMAPFMLGQAPQELQPHLMQAIASLSSSNSESTVTATLNVPGAIVQVLKDNPDLLGPMSGGPGGAGPAGEKNNLKQIGLAMHNYHDTFNHFPAADGNGEPAPGQKTGLSWRVYILPFLEEAPLYNEFHLDEPWDSDHNKAMIARMPTVYQVPGIDAPGETSVHVFASPDTPFDPAKPTSMRDILDGTSNTLMAVVAGPETAVPWTKPGGLEFDAANPLTALGTLGPEFLALLCDGSVRSISSQIDAAIFSLLVQHRDGQAIGDF